MKSIDAEIFELERRLHQREASISRDARELRNRSAKALMSPLTIVAALALGFVVAGSAARRKARATAPYRDRRRQSKQPSKGLAAGGLLMTAAAWLIRNQFGGPVGLAQFAVSKIRKNRRQAPSLRTGV